MIQLDGVITAVSPLRIGSGQSKGTFIQTLDHIPGRTLRGMLGYYLFKNDKQLFDSTGIDEEKDISKMGIFFKNAYPVENDEVTVASPLNLRWCKRCCALFERDERECKSSVNNKPCLIETKCPITRDKHASMPQDSELKPYHIQSIDSGARFGFRMLVRDEFADKIIEALRNA
jgi:CRISPR/Cas system CSM-associated protein Csm3 (group 7 of RAMP superfamily)